MVTTSIRIREPAEPSGVIYGARAAARKYAKYGLSDSLISKWIKQGLVKATASRDGVMVIDDRSLRAYIQNEYRPQRDNQNRQTRSRTIPEMQAEKASSNGHHAALAGRGSRPAAPDSPPALNTREYVQLYYADQTRRHGQTNLATGNQELRAKTKESYGWVLDRFCLRFPLVPLDRKPILDYMHGLTNLKRGGPLGGGSKMLVHRQLSSFFNWLVREQHISRDSKPDLTNHGLISKRERALPLRIDEIRALRKRVRNHSEFTIILLLAQTGVRIGELCTIRPELLHDHWVEVFGKPTKANPTGWRQVPLPDQAYDHLLKEFKVYGQLVKVNSYGRADPLAGPVEKAEIRRAIDLKEGEYATLIRPPQTYRVRPVPGCVTRIQGLLRRRLLEAGVYEPGKNAHSFRRSYQAEFVHNGGNRDYYRAIMGHFQKTSMDDLYNHLPIAEVVEQARQFAPRRFLEEVAAQAELQLDRENLKLTLADADDDDEDE